jgi:hypothetical protein
MVTKMQASGLHSEVTQAPYKSDAIEIILN